MLADTAQPITATYRLQVTQEFGFDAAAALVPYLAALGVSHVYISPPLQATPGSIHGYDVVDHSKASEDLGGDAGFTRLAEAVLAHGLRMVVDVVPNHMHVASRDNRWWWDVLKHGLHSAYSGYFDIMWFPPEERLHGKVLLPLLHAQFGRVIDEGLLQVALSGGEFVVQYHGNEFPLTPGSLGLFLNAVARRTGHERLAFILDLLQQLPEAGRRAGERVGEQERARMRRDTALLMEDLMRTVQEEEVAPIAAEEISRLNEDQNRLDLLLRRQHYRLAYWRTADHELNYRRFFNIGSLGGLRMEEEEVFQDTHRLLLEWYGKGWVHGFRIDHPDGLYDPQHYFERLAASAPGAYLVVEKVLERQERLPRSWPVHGTTGYNFLNLVNGLLVDTAGERHFTRFYNQFTESEDAYETVLLREKRRVLETIFTAELTRVTNVLMAVCERHRRYRDYVRRDLAEVLSEVLVHFPVYRSYTRPIAERKVRKEDAALIAQAVASARAARPELDQELFDFIERLLLLKVPGEREYEFVQRFQQLTGPLMAKGAEDTAFYVYNRLLCLNEVGGDPGHFGVGLKEFHRECQHLQKHWPLGMLNTSTHDTKRSEDVRARLAVLSEMPREWAAAVRRWSRMNRKLREHEWPERNTEYVLYQLLVGAWPITGDRLRLAMVKSVREAKQHTHWTAPCAAYEQALEAFIYGLLESREFLEDLEAFLRPFITLGRLTALSQAAIKLTAPGVPDIYQGTELWDLSLVDPDNRRPVDFALRSASLEKVHGLQADAVLAHAGDTGLAKLFLTQRLLTFRREHPHWFGSAASYRPLWAEGSKAKHVVAYVRSDRAITVAPRLVRALDGEWDDTRLGLPEGCWRNVLTGEEMDGGVVGLAELLATFPVAVVSNLDAI